ncbi:E3 ubiquitin-protein ligase RNF135 [Emydura macquarii macquarii]|uniref:E3 ubiquitin-protein ligase RNF135 n=1 Tax=Emydura macquarii macquarii TaxID=1129001 RepID=UPI00352BC19A
MAAAANPVKNLHDEVTCSLCLEYFKDPIIITKCAHSFCRACITQYCKELGTDVCCPHCRKSFHQKDLLSNRQLANVVEIIQDLKRTAEKPGEESELEKHQEALKLFHEADQKASESWDRNSQAGLPPDRIAWETKVKLELSEVSKQIATAQDAIFSSKQDSVEINEYVSQIKGLITEDFCAMKQFLETQERATLMVIEQEQQVAQQKIEAMIGQLTTKVNKLTEIKTQLEKALQDSTVEQLSDASSKREICIGSPEIMTKITLDAEKISVVTSAVEGLKKQLETLILKKYPAQLPQGLLQETSVCSTSVLSASGIPEPIISSQFSQWAVNVTFDLQRIHRYLEITSENKKVIVSRFPLPYEPTPKRFCISQVMCSQSFSDGCHYWEVSTKDSNGWAVGVADGNIGKYEQLGRTELSWCVEWTGKNKQLSAWHRNQETRLSEDRPLKVGVFLDLPNKHLSFYSLTDKETLLHRFEINIPRPVYPAFWQYGLDEEGSLTINHINRA